MLKFRVLLYSFILRHAPKMLYLKSTKTELGGDSIMSRRHGSGGADIHVIRFRNLRKLAERLNDKTGKGGQKKLAEKIGIKPVYMSQLIGRKPTRFIGGRTARKVENALNLPYGWMDQAHQFDVVEQPPPRVVPVIGEFRSSALLNAMGKAGMEFLRKQSAEVLHIHSDDTHAYAMRVNTDEFSPRIYPGELIALEPSTEIQAGDEVMIFTKGRRMTLCQVLSLLEREVIVTTIVQSDRRWAIRRSDIVHMHYLAGVFRPRSTRHLTKKS